MYVALLAVLVISGLTLLASGSDTSSLGSRRIRRTLGAVLLALAVGLPLAWNFSAEWLWFSALGQRARFEQELLWRFLAPLLGALFSGGLTALLVRGIPKPRARLASLMPALAALGGAALLASAWSELLLWWHAAPSGMHEPLFDHDVSFYLFTLPLLDRLHTVALFALACAGVGALSPAFRWDPNRGPVVREPSAPAAGSSLGSSPSDRSALPLVTVLALFGVALAIGRWLESYHLLYRQAGVLTGASWTDVHLRAPTLRIGAVLIALLALAPWLSALYRKKRPPAPEALPALVWSTTSYAAIGLLWVLGFSALPATVEWLVVLPREISYEKPYLARNIRFTRAAFGLDAAEEATFAAKPRLDRQTIRERRATLDEVRLWDWRALLDVYDQFQVMRLYYEFHDVDIDRYRFAGGRHQVMVSARELEQRNLPPESHTFVNRRFKYTHGYGITMAAVNGFTPEGLPDLLIGDIPPLSRYPELEVKRPEIYYGERTEEAVIVNSREEEFDYPRGSENVYTRYRGKGGVAISNLWRRLSFGWLFDGTPLVLSNYITAKSRIMWRRRVRERVAHLAPFLTLDDDPYIVVMGGKLYWIIDGYTTSKHYPYSEAYTSKEEVPLSEGRSLRARTLAKYDGVNYVRNSVKAVVDAYEGTVSLYLFDEHDPIASAWARAYPGLLLPAARMPKALREHVRYPHELLLLQGRMYAKFHMTDPEVFYNQEDLWVRATENYAGSVQPVEPYYVMWNRSESEAPELTVMLPFTPKGRQVLVGWLAGTLGAEGPPRLLTYFMPKDRTVPGPQQFEAKIDQDGDLRRMLTLWESSGSSVIRGNVLAIPLGETLLYVEPIYLRARTAAYPELRLVVVMDGERLGYGESFEQALERLLEERPAQRNRRVPEEPAAEPPDTASEPRTSGTPQGDSDASVSTLHTLAEQAQSAFERYLRLQAEGRFVEAGRELEQLQRALRALLAETAPRKRAR